MSRSNQVLKERYGPLQVTSLGTQTVHLYRSMSRRGSGGGRRYRWCDERGEAREDG